MVNANKDFSKNIFLSENKNSKKIFFFYWKDRLFCQNKYLLKLIIDVKE